MPDIKRFFEKETGHVFQNLRLLEEALTHSSYANEKGTVCNERLEFLGDSVLSIIVSKLLYLHTPSISEGEMTRVRATVVCETTLAACAKRIGLGPMLRLGRGEARTGGAKRASVLADAMEAVIAALYLDAGYTAAEKWVTALLEDAIREAILGQGARDYKTILQEKFQKKNAEALIYTVLAESGPDHDKSFDVGVFRSGEMLGRGTGRSKKQAEQAAAQNAMELLS